jgi:hypothetical protein
MLSYQIDTSDVQVFLNKFALEYEAATRLFFLHAKEYLKNILIETIMAITQKGFPPIYVEHLVEVINANPPIVVTEAGVEINLMLLGTYEDYAAGFHRHAIGMDNKFIELPSTGQTPKYSTAIRTIVWEDKIYPTFLYEDTLYNRIGIWGTKAPEWWVLQNGSETEPVVTPQPLAELIAARATIELPPLYDQALQEAVALADKGLGIKPGGQPFYNVRGGNLANTGQWSKR